MKHTDFYNVLESIKRQEQKELWKALKAHNGKYSWYKNGKYSEQYPIIAVNFDGAFPSPIDVKLRSISIVENHILFIGEDKEACEPVSFLADDIFAGQIGYILDLIEETDTVKDVGLSRKVLLYPFYTSK